MYLKLSDKIGSLFCNDFNSDIKFNIESENIEYPAHKLIIGLGSPVLWNMVYGNGTTLAASTITIQNHSSNDFLPILKYLYTGILEWNLDNVVGILDVGKYLGINEVENLFDIYVTNTIHYENALDIYARFFHVNNSLSRSAMKIIQLILSKILSSENEMLQFFGLPAEALSQILRMDELAISSEEELFKKMISWSEKAGLDQASLSIVLGDQIKLIRFADMKIGDYKRYDEFLQEQTNSRWKIKVIRCSKLKQSIYKDNNIKQIKANDGLEIIKVSARHKTIRIHGLSTLTVADVYVKVNQIFELIPLYRSKIFQNEHIDHMFENAIEIAKNTTIEVKVPTCSSRSKFKENDLFSMQTVREGNIAEDFAIQAIFISTR